MFLLKNWPQIGNRWNLSLPLIYLLVSNKSLVEFSVNKQLQYTQFSDYMANITFIKENMKFPNYEDLNGAAVALTRLQDTYNLETSSLARGELNGIKYSAELTAADCFELGRQSYNNGDHYHTLLWMREADLRMNRESNDTVDRTEILEYLAFSTYKQGEDSVFHHLLKWKEITRVVLGNIPLALDLTNKLLEIIPSHPRALGNKVYYEDELQKFNQLKRKGEEGELEAQSDEAYVSDFLVSNS